MPVTVPRVISRATALTLIALLILPAVALAHEQRDISGYHLVVGFSVEPAIEGVKNGIDLRVTKDDEPVEGLGDTLEVEIAHTDSGVTRTFPLRGVFNAPGRYTTDLIPTAAGQYSFRFFGTIEGTAIDETFTSGENTFGDVQSPADLEFPEALPASRELVAGVRGATAAAADANDAASGARTLAYAGIALGVIGIAVGAAGIAMATRRRA